MTPSPLNPLGVKGTGEAGVIPVSAVIAEAVEDALAPFGARISSMPLFPDDVLRAHRVGHDRRCILSRSRDADDPRACLRGRRFPR